MTDGEAETIGGLRERFEAQLAEIKKASEESTKNAADAAKRADEAERKLAFAEAGINLGDAKAKMFVKGYDGELDPTKIKSAWTEVFGESKPDTGAQQEQEADAAALSQMNQVTSGTPVPTGANQAALIEGMNKILRDGGTNEQMAAFMRVNGLPVAEGF